METTGGLGNTYGIGVPPHEGRVVRRYALQDAARFLLPEHRVSVCLRIHAKGNVEGNVEVHAVPGQGRAYYKGLAVCGSVWVCPVCAAKIAGQRARELRDALARHPELFPYMLTLTLQHRRGDSLEGLLKSLKGALRFARSGASWQRVSLALGVVGSITGLEGTYSDAAGWHPHSHVLLLADRELTDEELDRLQVVLSERFGGWLTKHGGYSSPEFGVKVQRADKGAASYVSKWDAPAELVAGHVKEGRFESVTPWGLLARAANGDARAGELFQEWARATKGMHMLGYSKDFREYLGLDAKQTDAEIAAAPESEAVLVLSLTRHQWRVVLVSGKRGELLQVAAKWCDAEAVWAWLSVLWRESDG